MLRVIVVFVNVLKYASGLAFECITDVSPYFSTVSLGSVFDLQAQRLSDEAGTECVVRRAVLTVRTARATACMWSGLPPRSRTAYIMALTKEGGFCVLIVVGTSSIVSKQITGLNSD